MKRRERIAAVEDAVRSESFRASLVEAIRTADKAVTADDVRVFALRLLTAQGVDHAGVSLRITWQPDKQKIEVWVKPAPVQPQPKKLQALP